MGKIEKSEALIKKEIKEWLDKRECFHFVYNPWMGMAGMTDRIVFSKGNPPICLEAKKVGKNATIIQEEIHKSLKKEGAIVAIVRSVADVIEVFKINNINLKLKENTKNGKSRKRNDG